MSTNSIQVKYARHTTNNCPTMTGELAHSDNRHSQLPHQDIKSDGRLSSGQSDVMTTCVQLILLILYDMQQHRTIKIYRSPRSSQSILVVNSGRILAEPVICFFYHNLITDTSRLLRCSKNVSVRISTKIRAGTSQNETPTQ